MVHLSKNNFYVLQFTELPYPDLKKYVVVPRFWIKGSRPRETQFFVAYPREDPQKTKKRACKKEEPDDSWNLYKAIIKYDAKEYNDATNWIAQQPDKNRLAKDECETFNQTMNSNVATEDAPRSNEQTELKVKEETIPKPSISTIRNVNKPQMTVPPLRNSPRKRKSVEETDDVIFVDNVLNEPISKLLKTSNTNELLSIIKEISDQISLVPEMMITGMTNKLESSTNQNIQNNTNITKKMASTMEQNNINKTIKQEDDINENIQNNTNMTNILQSDTNQNVEQNSNTHNVQPSKRIETKRISVVSDEFLFEDSSKRDATGHLTEANNNNSSIPSLTVSNLQPEVNDVLQRANQPVHLNNSSTSSDNPFGVMPQQGKQCLPNQREERVHINGIISMVPALLRDVNHGAPTHNVTNVQPSKNTAPNIFNQPYPIPQQPQVQPYPQNTEAPRYQGMPRHCMTHRPPALQFPQTYQMLRHPINPGNYILSNNLHQVPHPQRFVGVPFADFRNRNDNPEEAGNRRLADQNVGHFVQPPGPAQVSPGHPRQFSIQAPILKGFLVQDPHTGSIFTQECPKGNEGNSVQAGVSNTLSSGRNNISSSAIHQLQKTCYAYNQRTPIHGPPSIQSTRNYHHHASIPLHQQGPPPYHAQTNGPIKDTTKIQHPTQHSPSLAPNPRMQHSGCSLNNQFSTVYNHSPKRRSLQDVRERLVTINDSRSDSKSCPENMASTVQNAGSLNHSDCSSKCKNKTVSPSDLHNSKDLHTMQSTEAIRVVENVGVDNIVFCLFLSYLWKSMQ